MIKKEYRRDEDAPSYMFTNAMSGGGVGSPDIVCDWCGRHHLCVNTDCDPPDYGDIDKDPRDQWKEYCKAEYAANPAGVVLNYADDVVSGQDFNGQIFVLGCPCNGLSRYEKFIWAEKDTIRNYLKVRIEQEHQWAEQELTKNRLAGIT